MWDIRRGKSAHKEFGLQKDIGSDYRIVAKITAERNAEEFAEGFIED
jgi:hypothetical protein